MASLSLVEKLAVTGAFLAVVALAVGTEDDPGLVVTGQETVRELRPPAPPAASLAPPVVHTEPPAPLPTGQIMPAAPAVAAVQNGGGDSEAGFDPELGRAPLDFSNGPPST